MSTAYSRIVVAYDGSEGAKRALNAALSLDSGAEIHVVAVEAHLPHYGATVGEVQEELETEQAEVRSLLEDVRKVADAAGVAVRTETVAGHPAHAIIEAAKTASADLIVIGHAGRSGLWGHLPGSTAERVARHATCSVLIVR